ncbi:hypothetical protein [Dokdonia sp.]|uniref:hypothetical protein n=1 Tax=Dokdonia sp. TaxID=2024995 RepID=UPI003267E73E
MKIISRDTNYTLLIIQLVIITLFIISVVFGFINTRDYLNLTENYNRITPLFEIIISTPFFKSIIFLLIPTIGIFLRNKIGWILMTSFFYFLFTYFLFSFIAFDHIQLPDVLIFTVIIVCIGLIIIAMNTKNISLIKYNIQRRLIISYNIVAYIIGVAITIYIAYLSYPII